jgi:hypothetical protein
MTFISIDVHGGHSDAIADMGAPVDDPSLGLSAQHVSQ